MFNLPSETFWLFAPWPVFWFSLAIILYVKFRKDDEAEEEYHRRREGESN